MILHDWGLIAYEDAREKMAKVHKMAQKDGQNHLIFCQHYNVFTVGAKESRVWSVPVVKSDRGGSITCHSPGQLICYFCFQVREPMLFYRNVKRAFVSFFNKLNPEIFYNPKQAGFYIENRKIASLGFRYKDGVSLHGVSVNIDVDLEYHNRVNPCALEGIKASSLKNEGVDITMQEAKEMIVKEILKAFKSHQHIIFYF